MSKKILLVTGDGILSEVISLLARKNYQVEVHKRASTASAIHYLKDDKSFECIIADECFLKGSAARMQRFSQESKAMIPVVGIFESSKLSVDASLGGKLYKKIEKSSLVEQILVTLADFLPKNKNSDEKYISAQLEGLLSFNKLGCDCYIKISDEKYLKVLNNGDFFGQEDYDKYKKKGIDKLYLPYQDVDAFIHTLSENLNSMEDLSLYSSPEELAKAANAITDEEQKTAINQIVDALNKAERKNLNYDDGVHVCSNTVKTIAKTVEKFGPTPEVMQLTKATVMLAIHTLQKSPELGQLFETVKESSDNFLADHSVMLANISCQLASLLGWNSELTYYKLTLAALTHDITLKNPKLARYRILADLMLNASEFAEDELESFIKHTENAAALVRGFRMIPPDVDNIVGQHHERPDGTGFPSKLNHTKISPLSSVFIVAHDLVTYIMNRQQKDNWNLVSFLNQHRLLYQYGVFSDIFTAMWNQMVNPNLQKKVA